MNKNDLNLEAIKKKIEAFEEILERTKKNTKNVPKKVIKAIVTNIESRIKELKELVALNYAIDESIHGNFYYHISLDGSALCGKNPTLATGIPIKAWGIVSHLGEKYCKECEELSGVRKEATLKQFIKCLSPANQQKALELIEDSHKDLIQGSWPELDALYAYIKREIKRFSKED